MTPGNRIHEIWSHPLYQEHYQRLQELEKDRCFCRHTGEHFLDVARLAYISVLEQGLPLSREVVYAAALLHDIGRDEQYQNGTPHQEAGARISAEILTDLDFSPEETAQILSAVRSHRSLTPNTAFESLFYQADKKSRNCFLCPAQAECNWPPEKKNMSIQY